MTNLRENIPLCFSTGIEGIYITRNALCIPIIFNVEAVNSQNGDRVSAARRGGANPAIIPGKRMKRSSRAIPGMPGSANVEAAGSSAGGGAGGRPLMEQRSGATVFPRKSSERKATEAQRSP